MALLSLPLFLLCSLLALPSFSDANISNIVGLCYGQLGNNLPTPTGSLDVIRQLKAKRVKLYDANPDILKALRNTDIQVSIMVPNQVIPNIYSHQPEADKWVKTNVVPYYNETKIRYILVGNEILSNQPNSTWFQLVPAMWRIRRSVNKFRLKKVKVGTPLAMDMLESSYPPSNGTFRSDLAGPVIKPLLDFLNKTKSFFFIDAYPYFPWAGQPDKIRLDYALLQKTSFTYTDPGSGLTYTNLLDQMLDAVVFAMDRLGYMDVRIFLAETGWPNDCDLDQIGGSVYNAATYNRNVVKKLTSGFGTPSRPGAAIPAFIFALYNENQKTGPGTERHFGLFYPNRTSVYEIDLSGKTPESKFKPLPKPTNNELYKGKIWCVVAPGANRTAVGEALSWACGQGNRTCDLLQKGKACYGSKSLELQASYAFSSYWAQFKSLGGSCYFNGLAVQTKTDPRYGNCEFPSVTLKA
ncbi:unnamed protein product [Cuscuta epithymum]|uniref:glucan endo-1,3-beta-D-glucosidase n=1 Tax=Cuscuta epithymum TaxID=186058 RepID=A0AAV0F1J4_9ASTE|nr:unnamed protein product [Cuscuta epithymum]CAH9129387.1 unnamed protein product [Cuscuta epithymum]